MGQKSRSYSRGMRRKELGSKPKAEEIEGDRPELVRGEGRRSV